MSDSIKLYMTTEYKNIKCIFISADNKRVSHLLKTRNFIEQLEIFSRLPHTEKPRIVRTDQISYALLHRRYNRGQVRATKSALFNCWNMIWQKVKRFMKFKAPGFRSIQMPCLWWTLCALQEPQTGWCCCLCWEHQTPTQSRMKRL